MIGVVETHGRVETEVMTDGIERLPMREITYRGRTMQEFDLDAALARKPAIILMDELAHSNVAGSRHPKRWQDVEELLAAGIDVYSTINVQHLETLNDIVSGITGIRVWETVPDRIFDEADEVVVVDFPPDELLERLRQGKVYMPQQARTAAKNFFRKGNLLRNTGVSRSFGNGARLAKPRIAPGLRRTRRARRKNRSHLCPAGSAVRRALACGTC